jgi:hypothetical protein
MKTFGTNNFAQSTLTPPHKEELKFSAFLKKEKTYTIEKKEPFADEKFERF